MMHDHIRMLMNAECFAILCRLWIGGFTCGHTYSHKERTARSKILNVLNDCMIVSENFRVIVIAKMLFLIFIFFLRSE